MRDLCWHTELLDVREMRRTFRDLPHSVWDETPFDVFSQVEADFDAMSRMPLEDDPQPKDEGSKNP